MPSLLVRRGASCAESASEALVEVKKAIDQPAMRVTLLFCSPRYDLAVLGPAIRRTFSCPVIACTSAGQLAHDGYRRSGMVGVSIGGDALEVRPYLIAPLSECRERTIGVTAHVQAALDAAAPGQRAFGFLVVDGLAFAEEGLAATLYHSIGRVPVVGGSAGDDLRFERTSVYWDGQFLSNAAVFSLFLSSLPFKAFQVQHFAPSSEERVVITGADPEQRLVRSIDGLPAAVAYAESLGLSTSDLNERVFSKHPLMLRLGSDYYVRSIRAAHADGSLTFYSAIDEGLVLAVGTGLDPIRALEERFRQLRAEMGMPALVLACDCVLRRLELEEDHLAARAGEILAANQVVGFSTYGEQFNAMHVNQTMTAVALAGP